MSLKYTSKDIEILEEILKTIASNESKSISVDTFNEIINILNTHMSDDPYFAIKSALSPFIKHVSKNSREFYDNEERKYYLLFKMNNEYTRLTEIDITNYRQYFKKAFKIIEEFLNKTRRPSTAESTTNRGGAGSMKYNGRNYKIHIGIRGGKYILVGADKKKVYI